MTQRIGQPTPKSHVSQLPVDELINVRPVTLATIAGNPEGTRVLSALCALRFLFPPARILPQCRELDFSGGDVCTHTLIGVIKREEKITRKYTERRKFTPYSLIRIPAICYM